MPTREEIQQKIVEIVSNKLNKPGESITPEMSFINDLGADSLDTVELVMDIEEAFDLIIPEEEAEKIETVGAAVDYVAQAVAKKEGQ